MKSYRVLAWKELLAQKVTSILILIAVILSTVTTTVIGQSIGILNAMRRQQAIAINGEKYAAFLQMSEEQLSELKEDARFSYIGPSISLGTDNEIVSPAFPSNPRNLSASSGNAISIACSGKRPSWICEIPG